MAELGIFDRTVGLLKKVIDLRQRRQQVVAGNIANADTPGYAPQELVFEADLKRAIQGSSSQSVETTHPKHIPVSGGGKLEAVTGKVVSTAPLQGAGDRNGVRLDQEMVNLAENQIQYEAAVQMLNKKMGLVKYVTQETR